MNRFAQIYPNQLYTEGPGQSLDFHGEALVLSSSYAAPADFNEPRSRDIVSAVSSIMSSCPPTIF